MLSTHPLIIDCDTGRDDALAIWLALGWGYNLRALVASYGNTIRENVSENCLRVLAFAGREDVELMVGALTPLSEHKGYGQVVLARQATSGNGMCNLELPKTARQAPAPSDFEALAARVADMARALGPIDYVVTGPATNIAGIARALGADFKKYIARITMMGGKLDDLWTVMPTPDFNTISDPHAVEALLQTGVEMRFVSMNTTWHLVLTLPEVEALEPTTDRAQFAKDLMIAHCKHFAPDGVFRFHDPCVLAALHDNDDYADAQLRVITDESAADFGRIVRDTQGHKAKLHQAGEAKRAALLHTMIEGLGFKALAKAA